MKREKKEKSQSRVQRQTAEKEDTGQRCLDTRAAAGSAVIFRAVVQKKVYDNNKNSKERCVRAKAR